MGTLLGYNRGMKYAMRQIISISEDGRNSRDVITVLFEKAKGQVIRVL